MKTKLVVNLILLLAIVILSFFVWTKIDYFYDDDDVIHIAFVGPLTGKDAEKGQSMRQALEMQINIVNEQRKDQQQKIVLDLFDDKNDPDTAYKMAQKIAKSHAVAVIGHRRSDCSVEGGKIYKKQGILAITPTSSETGITRDNEWFFRTIYNNEEQARFLAKYAKKFLLQQHNTVSIIYLDTIYGKELANIFGQTLQKMNVDVKYKWKLTNNASKQEQRIKDIVSDLQNKSDDAGLIFLATQSNEGVKLVKRIKDVGIKNQLIAPDSYANFHEGFKDEPKEKRTPGYYTDGIYVASFIVDQFNQYANDFNSRYKEEYQKDLSSAAFSTVDAASVIIEIIRQTKSQGKQESLSSYRERLRNKLANIDSPNKAIKGFTGFNFFNIKGDISKPISIGIYKNNHLISAPLQLTGFDDDDQKHKTVVYTGVQFNKISDIDLNTGNNEPDFYLWFRFNKKYDGHVIEPQDIEFINAVSPIELGQPIIEETIDGQTYLLYRVKNQPFKENIHLHSTEQALFNVTEQAFFNFKHALGVSFRHRKLDKDELIYVSDVLGTSVKTSNQEKQELISLNDWKVDKIRFFHDVTKKEPLGNPKFLGGNTTYSTFNASVWIKNKAYAYHSIIPLRFATIYFIFTAIITLLLVMVSYAERYLKYLWFVQAFFAFLLLVSAKLFLETKGKQYVESLFADADIETIRAFIITTFDILWWLIPAILLNVAVRRFLWTPLEEKTGRSVPGLMRFLISFIIYSLALFGVIAFVFEQPIASLLATGGLMAGVIGLAIQTNLSNIFSGIALSIERSFRVGDWVKIGAFDEGKVVDMNWRVTKIQTRRKYILSIPNGTVSASDIHNFSYPDNQYWLLCTVYIDPKHDPRKIEEVLIRAVLSVKEGVMTDAKPVILFNNIKEGNVDSFVASYAVFFKTEDYQYKPRVLKNVWRSIWIHLSQAGIIIPAEAYHQEEIRRTTALAPTALTPTQLGDVLTKGHLQNMMTGV
jgi:branched-chain amino acid transport system substrate-binding protein